LESLLVYSLMLAIQLGKEYFVLMSNTPLLSGRSRELKAIEAQLIPGEPVLVQSLLHWNIGIATEEPSVVVADRCEGIRVKGYVDLHFSAFMYLVQGGMPP